MAVFDILEHDGCYMNQNPRCEPQLGRRGLYRAMGGHRDEKLQETAMLWVLNQSDGTQSLLDIAELSGLAFDLIKDAAAMLQKHDLLKECGPSASGPTNLKAMSSVDQLTGCTAVVTGASGFIGSHLVRRLMAAGSEWKRFAHTSRFRS